MHRLQTLQGVGHITADLYRHGGDDIAPGRILVRTDIDGCHGRQ